MNFCILCLIRYLISSLWIAEGWHRHEHVEWVTLVRLLKRLKQYSVYLEKHLSVLYGLGLVLALLYPFHFLARWFAQLKNIWTKSSDGLSFKRNLGGRKKFEFFGEFFFGHCQEWSGLKTRAKQRIVCLITWPCHGKLKSCLLNRSAWSEINLQNRQFRRELFRVSGRC